MRKILPWLGLLGAALAFLSPIRNPDLWWHLSCARYMARNGRLPSADFLSHTCAGRPWLDFEWLAQLCYGALGAWAGCGGLVGLRAGILLLSVGAIMLLLRLYGSGPAGQGLSALLLGAVLFPYADLRPDNFSLLFFSLLLLGLEARRLGRLRLDGRLALAAAGLFALWANLHLGLVHGLILIACYAAGEAAQAALPAVYGRGPMGSLASIADSLKLLALAVLGSLLNPHGWRLYGVVLDHARSLDMLRESICEWMPPDPAKYWNWPYWALMALSLASLLLHFLKTRRTPYALLLAAGYFALASSSCQRHLSYFCLVAVPAFFWAVRDLGGPVRPLAWGGWLSAALLAAYLACYVLPFAPALARGACPPAERGLAAFLAEAGNGLKGGRLYNSWADGGYLGYVLHPRYHVFCDGRYLFHDLLAETRAAARDARSWAALMDRRRVEVACLKRSLKGFKLEAVARRDGTRAVVGRPYHVAYMPRREWALVYWDRDNLILVRRAAADPEWLRRNEYLLLAADDEAFLAERLGQGLVSRKLARRELARHLRQAGGGAEDETWLDLLYGPAPRAGGPRRLPRPSF